MSSRADRAASAMSRRRFVQIVTAGSAALLAGSSDNAGVASAQSPAPAAPGAKAVVAKKPPLTPAQKEFERQRAGTLATLKTLREHALAPGGDLAYVFRPMPAARKGR